MVSATAATLKGLSYVAVSINADSFHWHDNSNQIESVQHGSSNYLPPGICIPECMGTVGTEGKQALTQPSTRIVKTPPESGEFCA